MEKNKKGWIRLVEAFFAVLLMISVMVLVIEQKYSQNKDIASEIYEREYMVLRAVQMSTEGRTDVIGIDLPMNTTMLSFPSSIQTEIDKMPSYINCAAKICLISDSDCTFEDVEGEIERDIYSRSVAIFADNSEYAPRKLKLFCWVTQG